jgi:hypothetical protein
MVFLEKLIVAQIHISWNHSLLSLLNLKFPFQIPLPFLVTIHFIFFQVVSTLNKFPAKILCGFVVSRMHATYVAHLIVFEFIPQIMYVEEYKLRSCLSK